MAVSKTHFVVCYIIGLVFVGLSFLFAMLCILFHYPEVDTSKGDQIIMDKEKPYILYKQRPDNLPHFCRQFRILIAGPYSWEDDEMIVQATTSMERPKYSNTFSTFSFTEDIHLIGSQTRSLSYFLPSSSRVDITSCGQGSSGDDDMLNIPIFNDYWKMTKWLNSDVHYPYPPNLFIYAQFPPCPSMTTVSFNTSGFSDSNWYLLLGSERQDDDDEDLRATLDLHFTKYSLEVPNPIDNCTAYPNDYCELDAPSGNDVYLMLEHSINSTYPYASQTRVVCIAWDQFICVMYFLVLPLFMSVCYICMYGLLIHFGYCLDCTDDSAESIELTRVTHHRETWRPRLGSLNDATSSASRNDLPGYDGADDYPTFNNDDGLASNFSTELNLDDISYLRQLNVLSSSTDVTMVTEPDNPPAYDSVTTFDRGSDTNLPPAPGYEEALQLSASNVTMGIENPPSYNSLTQPD